MDAIDVILQRTPGWFAQSGVLENLAERLAVVGWRFEVIFVPDYCLPVAFQGVGPVVEVRDFDRAFASQKSMDE